VIDLLRNKDIDRLLAIGEQQRADLLGLTPYHAQADASEASQEVASPDEPVSPAEAVPA
jgi:hypothetical protein